MTKLLFVFALLLSTPGCVVEIATGKMLGKGYEVRSFYVRGKDGRWIKTYTGPRYRTEAALTTSSALDQSHAASWFETPRKKRGSSP